MESDSLLSAIKSGFLAAMYTLPDFIPQLTDGKVKMGGLIVVTVGLPTSGLCTRCSLSWNAFPGPHPGHLLQSHSSQETRLKGSLALLSQKLSQSLTANLMSNSTCPLSPLSVGLVRAGIWPALSIVTPNIQLSLFHLCYLLYMILFI